MLRYAIVCTAGSDCWLVIFSAKYFAIGFAATGASSTPQYGRRTDQQPCNRRIRPSGVVHSLVPCMVNHENTKRPCNRALHFCCHHFLFVTLLLLSCCHYRGHESLGQIFSSSQDTHRVVRACMFRREAILLRDIQAGNTYTNRVCFLIPVLPGGGGAPNLPRYYWQF